MPEGEKKKILIVDDNEEFRNLVAMVFEDEYQILKADDGETGISLAQQEKPSVILLDVMMPKTAGVEVMRLLQADMDTRPIPVIVCTASNLDESTMEMMRSESNVSAVLRKPCTVQILRDQIQRALSKPR